MNKKRIGAVLLLSLVPVFTHFYLLNRFSLNIPFKDDYRVFIGYINYFINTQGAWNSFLTMFIPDNESHPVLMHLITLGQYKLEGNINFRHILFFCNLFLLLFSGVLAMYFYRIKEYWNIAIMAFLVFNAFHHEMYFRTDVATYQLLAFSFAIFMFYCAAYYSSIHKITKVFFFLVFFLVPFGSVNGMLASVLVLLYFILEKSNKRLILTLSIILIAQVMFLVYISESDDSKPFTVLGNLKKYNFEILYAYFLSFGGILNVSNIGLVWTMMVGSSVLVFFYTFYKLFFPFQLKLNFEKMVFIFCTASLALIVILRYNYWIKGYDSVLESRYKLYGAIIFLLFFALVIRNSKNKLLTISFSIIISGLIFLVGLYKGTTMLKLQNLEQITEVYNVSEGCYEESFARKYYATKEMQSNLLNNGAYSFEAAHTIFDNLLINQSRLTEITNHKLEKAEMDPTEQGDWNAMPFGLSTFKVEGKFPKRRYYFIKFKGEGNRSVIIPLLPPRNSFLRKKRHPKRSFDELSKDFYASAFEGVNFDNYEIYGVDELGL